MKWTFPALTTRAVLFFAAILIASPLATEVALADYNNVKAIVCDKTTPANCVAVDSSGKITVNGVTIGATTPDAAISTGYQQLTSLASASSFTPPALTTFCVLTAEGATLRFRTDGTNPTASVGYPMLINQPFIFRMSITNLTATKFIQQTPGGILNVDCYKDT